MTNRIVMALALVFLIATGGFAEAQQYSGVEQNEYHDVIDIEEANDDGVSNAINQQLPYVIANNPADTSFMPLSRSIDIQLAQRFVSFPKLSQAPPS